MNKISGIFIWYSDVNIIINNSFFSNGDGLFMRYSNSNVIENNSFKSNNEKGLCLIDSNLNIIKNNSCLNHIENNDHYFNNGISLSNSDFNIIEFIIFDHLFIELLIHLFIISH